MNHKPKIIYIHKKGRCVFYLMALHNFIDGFVVLLRAFLSCCLNGFFEFQFESGNIVTNLAIKLLIDFSNTLSLVEHNSSAGYL